MKLDLIIPTYNRAGLLKECLDSICRATIPAGLEVTVFVVDNRSTDDTRDSVMQRPDGTPTIRYLFAGRPGKSAALNDALAVTSGELVGMIDDDEQIDSQWFEVAYREMSDPGIDFIGGPYHPNWESAVPDWLPAVLTGTIGIIRRPERVAFSREFDGMLMGGNAVVRRSILNEVRPYPEDLCKIGDKIRLGEDEVIYQRLLALGARGMVVPDLVIHHWIPASRLTKPYYREWVIGRGISIGSQFRDPEFRERGVRESSLFGIPRYMFGQAAKGCVSMLFGTSRAERFAAQLSVLNCGATLYGRHFSR